jgi:hypothetical protein
MHKHSASLTRRVASCTRFDFNHLGSHVGQHLGTKGTKNKTRQVEYPNPTERFARMTVLLSTLAFELL